MAPEPKRVYQFGPCRLDVRERVLLRDGQAVALTPKAFDILVFLVENAGRLIEKNELMEKLWPGTFVEEGNLTFNISVVRKVLGEWENGDNYIKTIPKRGYRFVADVVQIQGEATNSAEVRAPETLQPLAEGPDEKPQSSRGTNSALPTVTEAPSQEASAQTVSERSRKWRVLAAFLGAATMGLTAYALWPRARPSPGSLLPVTRDGRNKSGPIVTDGSRLYFTESINGEFTPSEVLISGGETAAVPTSLHNFFLFDISPNGAELLGAAPYTGEGGAQLWAVPLLGGSPRRLGSLHGAAAAWSPDGLQLAYVDGSGLFVATSEGSEPHQIARLPKGYVDGLRWSPRRDSLGFGLAAPGTHSQSSLWEVSADGTGLRQLLPGWNVPPMESYGSWISDGKWFVFASKQNGRDDIWALRERLSLFPWISHEPIRVTANPLSFGVPTPSKDGKRLFVVGSQEAGELSRYDAAHEVFEPYPSTPAATWVSFTSGKQWAAYTTYPDETLWRMRSDGTDKKQLTFVPDEVAGFAWSPDGKEIALYSLDRQQHSKLGLISRDGGPIAYPIPGDRDQGIPTWSADGNQLVFGDVPTNFGEDDGTHAIRVFDRKTRQLSDLPGSKGLWTSRWSPDGRYIAALWITSQNLMLYDCGTQKWRELGAGPADSLTWSRDSRYIYYDTSAFVTDAAVYRLRINDGYVERVASLGGFRRARHGWSGLAPDDSPLILRDIGTSEIYALDVDWP